jgi:aminoglycoside phosphotransferase (APT) family kinase protein
MSPSLEQGAAAVLDLFQGAGGPRPVLRSRLLDTPNGERLVAEFSLGGSAPVIAKCYADETGSRSFRIMAAVGAALGRHACALAVPAPLGYDAARRCLVQTRAAGTPYLELAGTASFLPALRRAGEALAELHDLPLAEGEEKRLADHVAELIRPHPRELARRLPRYAARIEALLRALEGAESRLARDVAPRPLHRDFHLRQLFLDGQRVWLIDWDLFARGDPALDLGNFLMYLETRLDADHQVAIEAFLDGYFSRAHDDVYPRIAPYKALNYLRRASKHCRLDQPGWPGRAAQMLERAEACLG